MLTVTITSAVELSSKQLENIKKVVNKKYAAQKIEYRQVVDAAVMGGISLRIGSTEFDGTLKRKFELLRNHLRTSV